MCIICCKPKGIKNPKRAVLQNCFENNSDGAGFAYFRPGHKSVHIVKGFLKFDELLAGMEREKINKDDSVIFHFRQATHGLTDKGNCHPFPLSDNIEVLRAENLKTEWAVAHNGIFSSMPKHNVLSDTQKFISMVLSSPHIKEGLGTKAVQELIKGYCGASSKLAFLSSAGISYIGTWIKDGGLYYSNSGFRSLVVVGGFSRREWFAGTNNKSLYEWKKCDMCDALGYYRPEYARTLCWKCYNVCGNAYGTWENG